MQVNCLKQYAQRSILGMILANHVSHGWIRKHSTQAERKTNKLLWSLQLFSALFPSVGGENLIT